MCIMKRSSHKESFGLFKQQHADITNEQLRWPFSWNLDFCSNVDFHTLSTRTCSYLIGNKGCHAYNGNPQDFRYQSNITKETMAIIEDRLHESVGEITVTDLDYKVTAGTGFRVGEVYLMSTYSVFKEKIAFSRSIITSELIRSKTTAEELQKLLGVTVVMQQDEQIEPLDVFVDNMLADFLRNHATDIKLLLEKLKTVIPKDVIVDLLAEKWRKYCIVTFMKEGEFCIDWDVKFGDEETNVTIVELKRIPGDLKGKKNQSFPPPLLIDEKDRIGREVQMITYRCQTSEIDETTAPKSKSGKPNPIISTNCGLFKSKHVREECIKWWKDKYGKVVSNDDMACFEKEFPEEYDKATGILVTKASRSFTQESSGSPMICSLKPLRRPVVTGIFLSGLPSFFYKPRNERRDVSQCKKPVDDSTEAKKRRDDSQSTKPSDGDSTDRMKGHTEAQFAIPSEDGAAKENTGAQVAKTRNDDPTEKYLYEKGVSTAKIAERLDHYGKKELKESIFDILRQVEAKTSQFGRQKPTDDMKKKLQAWKEEDENCYNTKGVKATQEKILSNNCVCVTGDPGSGKSMSIRHSALYLYYQYGFTVYPITSPEDFFKHLDENKKQVFVIDDILGIHSLHRDLVSQWSKWHNVIKGLLCNETKILASLRRQLVQPQNTKLQNFIFLEKSKNIELDHGEYRLDIFHMKDMLRWRLAAGKIQNVEVDEVLGKSQFDETVISLPDSFPFLCNLFCKVESLRKDPKEFFSNPFSVLHKAFEDMKTKERELFCGLVLCAGLDGKLSGGILNTIDSDPEALDDKPWHLWSLLGQKDCLPVSSNTIRDKLIASDSVYVIRIGNDFEISHRIIYDIVTYVFHDMGFIFEYGTSQFIKDRVRTDKRTSDDQYVVVCRDGRDVEQLASRLIADLWIDLEMGALFIVENHNIDDARLISCLREKLKRVFVKPLYRQCFNVIHENHATFKQSDDGDVIIPQLKLIELLLSQGIDCNSSIDGMWPLHISVSVGSLELTRLLLDYGADVRYCNSDNRSVLHLACLAERNNINLIKLLAKKCVDKVPAAIKVLAVDTHDIRSWLKRHNVSLCTESDQREDAKRQKLDVKINVQLEKIGASEKDRLVTDNVNEVESKITAYSEKNEEINSSESVEVSRSNAEEENSRKETHFGQNKLQLVEVLHDSFLNSFDKDKETVLHFAVRHSEASILEELLKLGSKLTCRNNPDGQGRRLDDWLRADCYLKHRKRKDDLLKSFDAKVQTSESDCSSSPD